MMIYVNRSHRVETKNIKKQSVHGDHSDISADIATVAVLRYED